MFSNLSKGSVLYGLDRRDKIKWFTASIEKVAPGMSKTTPNGCGCNTSCGCNTGCSQYPYGFWGNGFGGNIIL